MGEDDAAKQAIDEALAIDHGNIEAQFADALYLAKQGNRREAAQTLQRIVKNQTANSRITNRAQQLLDELQK